MEADSNEEAEKGFIHQQFLNRERNFSHLSVETEFEFYYAVKDGDLKKVKEIMLPLQNPQMGHLSDDHLRNLKYHLVITIALITRFCIEGGMNAEDAYSLSDIYIQRLDKINNDMDLSALHKQAVLVFTKRMSDVKGNARFSIKTARAMDYIDNHLHEKIYLEDLAEAVGVNRTYICDLFKKETGITINSYIQERKIETACNMLKFSEYSATEIASYLNFSSHSHFISCFKKTMGLTPQQYKEAHYRKILMDISDVGPGTPPASFRPVDGNTESD